MFANEGGGFIDPTAQLWQKVYELEAKLEKNEKIIEKIGLIMGEDFNFDDLLDEIETVETPVETEPTIEVPADPIPAVEPELDLDTELDDLLGETNDTETNTNATAETPEVLPTEDTLPDTTPSQIPTTKVDEISYDTVGVEFAEEYVKYWKEINSLEQRKKAAMDAFKNELAVMKEEYTDVGVDIKAANYVRGVTIRQMKESTEESVLMDAMDKMMKKDPNLKDSFIPFLD